MTQRSWYHGRIALQLLAEEHVHAPLRRQEERERAEEDAKFKAAQKGLG